MYNNLVQVNGQCANDNLPSMSKRRTIVWNRQIDEGQLIYGFEIESPEELANDREKWMRLCGTVIGLNGL